VCRRYRTKLFFTSSFYLHREDESDELLPFYIQEVLVEVVVEQELLLHRDIFTFSSAELQEQTTRV
jgi:hypothetical protein